MRKRAAPLPGPTTTLLVILLLTLSLSLGLAYQAWDAAHSHREATAGALRDYAGFASWELRRKLETSVTGSLNQAMLPLQLRVIAGGIPSARAVAGLSVQGGGTPPGCPCPGAMHDFFTLDPAGPEVEVHQAKLPDGFRQWLATDFLARIPALEDTVAEAGAVPSGGVLVVRQPQGAGRAHTGVPYDSRTTVVYAQSSPFGGAGVRIYGFAVDVSAMVGPLVATVIGGPSLLPPSLTELASNEEVLSVAVWSTRGDTLYRGGGTFTPGTEVLDTIRTEVDTLITRVAVRPEVAGQLVIGGLPRSRLPLLLGGVALTLGLIVVGAVQLRRQQQLFRLRSDFVAGVSHELRTPLAQIRLFSELLASGRLEEAQRAHSVRIINEEAQRLTYLVENVLRFSRSERSGERITPVPTHLFPLLDEIVGSFAPLTRSREVRIHTRVPHQIRVRVDPDALRQILLNLLDNAVKYGPVGQRIEVGASAVGERVQIWVEDEGPGVPEQDRQRIWEPYRRLERDVETATGGSGIGLALVRELVELHGGRVDVSSRDGGGSRFVISLPAEPSPDQQDLADAELRGTPHEAHT